MTSDRIICYYGVIISVTCNKGPRFNCTVGCFLVKKYSRKIALKLKVILHNSKKHLKKFKLDRIIFIRAPRGLKFSFIGQNWYFEGKISKKKKNLLILIKLRWAFIWSQYTMRTKIYLFIFTSVAIVMIQMMKNVILLAMQHFGISVCLPRFTYTLQ